MEMQIERLQQEEAERSERCLEIDYEERQES